MIVYFCLLIPIITSGILIFFFRSKVVWWELLVLLGVTTIFIFTAKAICINNLTSDTEYLGGYVTEVRYYEPWNEYIHRICSYKCGKSTCYRDCSYVRYHSEYWEAITTLGDYNISKEKYNYLLNKFKIRPSFYDMNRHYYTKDGDMYFGKWKGDDETLEHVTAEHSYENRPQASRSIFNFTEIDTFEIRKYKPQQYPEITGQWVQPTLIGYNDPIAQHKLDVLNARLGQPKQLRVYVMVFNDKPKEAAIVQEKYWKGANKNEFILCVGLKNNSKVDWVYDFSWTDAMETKVDIRTFVEAQSNFEINAVIDFMYSEMVTKWKRKDFHDFDYLVIEPTLTQIIWIVILSLIVDIGISVWVIKNEFENEDDTRIKKRRKKTFRYL